MNQHFRLPTKVTKHSVFFHKKGSKQVNHFICHDTAHELKITRITNLNRQIYKDNKDKLN